MTVHDWETIIDCFISLSQTPATSALEGVASSLTAAAAAALKAVEAT